MTEKDALELVQQYMNGWKQNYLSMITSCLAKHCIVIESHGPTYHSVNDIERWFALWLAAKSSIFKWDTRSFSFCEKQQTAFCEWDFSCTSNDIAYAFPGISVVKFSEHKILFIHEYRMTHAAHEWQRDKLQSE